MATPQLPDDIAARLNRPLPWWKLLDDMDLSTDDFITRQASSFAQRLSKFRVAVVPDPRIDGAVTGNTPALAFRVVSCLRHATHDYAAAKVQLERDLAFLMVKGRPSPRELNWIRNRGLEPFRLDGESRERLLGWLELRLHEPIENAEDVVRAIGADPSIPWRGDQYARYFAMCEADGPLDVSEREALKLVKQDRGIAPKRQLSIFDAPPEASEATSATVAPVPLRKAQAPKTVALLLDETRIAAIETDTRAVGQLLSEVFVDDTSVVGDVTLEPKEPPAAAWQAALEVVSQRDTWPVEQLHECCQAMGLLPQAILDLLNERALDACGELLLEGDEQTLDVNHASLVALRSAL